MEIKAYDLMNTDMRRQPRFVICSHIDSDTLGYKYLGQD